jgi:hypothetical protein
MSGQGVALVASSGLFTALAVEIERVVAGKPANA